LSKALSGIGDMNMLIDAHENKMPIEGKVKEVCKGGVIIELMKHRAFCPISQLDVSFIENAEGYVGNPYTFLITRIEESGRNIVVSRRRLLQAELDIAKEKFLAELSYEKTYQGKVVKVMPYGVFVELTPGVEGMVHISELSWSRVDIPENMITSGDVVDVKVLKVEPGEKPNSTKISLSMKQTSEDPWDSVGTRFHIGDTIDGRVTRCMDFGVFVEIGPGTEGLVHISEMSYTQRVLKTEDIVQPGEVVPVYIKEIDEGKKRISLSIRDAMGDPWTDIQTKYKVGQSVEGTIEKKEAFGYFITLEPGITGLLPKSHIRAADDPTKIEKLRPNDRVTVFIEKIIADERKVTLNVSRNTETDNWRNFASEKESSMGSSMGSLGEKLREAMKGKKQ
ncbi:S1 RNA-binding domain-containing protein, partial [Desulfobacterales bacterium HSG17]|nr:S1 RNA-binding domain-containing protein [Desulfobacterales bacterium HSG17]